MSIQGRHSLSVADTHDDDGIGGTDDGIKWGGEACGVENKY